MRDQILVHLSELKRKMKISFFICLFLLIQLFTAYSQPFKQAEECHVLFYNVENLFDTLDDPEIKDDEFTAKRDRYWTEKRKSKKLLDLSKAILGSCGWSYPVLIGLCEIENRSVLKELISKTPLQTEGYKIIHKESPDHRGIDVALLYDEQQFYPLSYSNYPMVDKNGEVLATREILYVKGVLHSRDTLHLFINHWPSRYGGLLETEGGRIAAAVRLREQIDSLIARYSSPKIIVMGDFNDQPTNKSIKQHLRALYPVEEVVAGELYNLSLPWMLEKKGTLKYRSKWQVFDQIIVSGHLLKAESGYAACWHCASIVESSYLLESDKRYGGQKPYRTYLGFRYHGGFSDHLPVKLKLELVDY